MKLLFVIIQFMKVLEINMDFYVSIQIIYNYFHFEENADRGNWIILFSNKVV